MTPAQFLAWRTRFFRSQRAAGEALGLSPRQIWSYEHGAAEVPKTVRLAMAAIALGLSDYDPS